MKIEILTKGIELNDEIKEYALNRIQSLDRLLSSYENIECNLRLGKDSAHKHGKIFYAEATISTNKKNFGARAEEESIQEAIDELKDELSKKIRRYNDKKTSLRNRGGRIIKDLLRRIKG